MLQNLPATLINNPMLLLPLIGAFFLSTSALYYSIVLIYGEDDSKETLITASIASLAIVYLFCSYLLQNFLT